MTSRPRVYARIRPQNDNELRLGGEQSYSCERGHQDVLLCNTGGEVTRTRFDFIFDTNATQDDVFKQVGSEVLSTLFSGYNATIFAYGQTGSGKTHTMEGSHVVASDRGIIPRLIEGIIQKLTTNPEITDWDVQLGMCQIYQEKIQDLFNGRRQLDIHLDRTGQYIAQGATWYGVKRLDEAISLYHEAVKQRATNATEMNLVSSRSHTILSLQMKWDEPTMPGCRAQLNLVDLAGSEKLYQSGATGEVMKEAISINKSLSALGNVVSKLVDAAKYKDKHVHVPYKDSKLTYLLQSSLGGGNLVHFILALSSSSLWRAETASTIEFGKRALQLVIRPVRNPIDYKRLEEMESMIEKMRNHIRNLEEELRTNKQPSNAFLAIKQLAQEGEEKKEQKRKNKAAKNNLKIRTELARIVANLPETLEDLTSHCVLFPTSRAEFRQMGGLEKLVSFIDKSPSTFYRAHAAHTVAHVIDDEGREEFGNHGGIEALERLLLIKEERCKEAACVALEAVCRGCAVNKSRVKGYDALVDLIFGYPNQQVQEAACTALASIVDMFPPAKAALAPLDVVKKLLATIRDAPEEVAHVTKAATTCLGKLAHGDTALQNEIHRLGGVDLLVDDVLFSAIGDRDHQVPILASYALVNLCCSNATNMATVKKHSRYEEVRFKLMEGLARAFGNNTVREGFGRATAQETTSPFPYYGVTICDDWTPTTCGGRPIFSTFMENPQFYLYVGQSETKVTIMIQDTLYEQRLQKKLRNHTVYMGLALFQADPDVAKAGLKQLDFHGKITDIAKFTSNCENTLHCTLPKSDAPYIVVPFTSQRGRFTTFALSAFADRPIELAKVPESTGWCRRIVHGAWTALTGRGGEGFDWRNNPQVRITVRETCKAVFVLSYLSLDQQRSTIRRDDAGDDEKANNRPRLNGRLFTHSTVAPTMRYLKAIIPLPQASPFIASNSFSSNSYVTTTATLQPGSYTFIPFTEQPTQETWRLSMFCDSDDFDIAPLDSLENEWHTHTVSTTWKSEGPIAGTLKVKGPFCIVASCRNAYIRLAAIGPDSQRVAGLDNFWHSEAYIEGSTTSTGAGAAASSSSLSVGNAASAQQVTLFLTFEGVMKGPNNTQIPATGNTLDIFVFTADKAAHLIVTGTAAKSPCSQLVNMTSPLPDLSVPRLLEGDELVVPKPKEESDGEEDFDDEGDVPDGSQSAAEIASLKQQLQQRDEANIKLELKVRELELAMTKLRRDAPPPSIGAPPPAPTAPGYRVTALPFEGSGAPPVVPLQPSVSGPMAIRGQSRSNSMPRPSISQRGTRGGQEKTPETAASPLTPLPRGASAPNLMAVGAVGAQPLLSDVSARLSALATSEKAPGVTDWARMRKEIKELQAKVQLACAAA